MYLRVCLLERTFKVIFYEHIPREFNTMANLLANYELDWHLPHYTTLNSHVHTFTHSLYT